MIRKNIEYEKRMLISKDKYETILSAFNNFYSRSLLIVNTYFDTEFISLIPKGYLFRLRNSDNSHYELTLKIAKASGNIEHNISLTSEAYARYNEYNYITIPKELLEEVKDFNIPNNVLYRKCVLKTERIEIPIDDYLLVLDYNTYNGVTDYNIEIEAPSMEKATSVLKDLCKTFFMKYVAHSPGKSSRAIATITKKKGK